MKEDRDDKKQHRIKKRLKCLELFEKSVGLVHEFEALRTSKFLSPVVNKGVAEALAHAERLRDVARRQMHSMRSAKRRSLLVLDVTYC